MCPCIICIVSVGCGCGVCGLLVNYPNYQIKGGAFYETLSYKVSFLYFVAPVAREGAICQHGVPYGVNWYTGSKRYKLTMMYQGYD